MAGPQEAVVIPQEVATHLVVLVARHLRHPVHHTKVAGAPSVVVEQADHGKSVTIINA